MYSSNLSELIKSALLGRYRLQEFIQFMSNTLMIFRQYEPDRLGLEAPYQNLLRQHESLQRMYKLAKLSEITPQLALLDGQRDQSVICLRKICDGYASHPNENLSACGKQILACMDKYGSKLYHLNYSAETAVLKKLVHELQAKPENFSALQEMHLEEVVNLISDANTQFEALFIQRLEEFSQYDRTSNKERIRLISQAYRTLVHHVDAHHTLAPSQQYSVLISHLNENIEHFNLMVEKRKQGAASKATDSTVDDRVGAAPLV